MEMIMGLVALAQQKWGMLGMICAYVVLFGIPVMSVLIELLDFIVKLTASKKDDEVAEKIENAWAKVLPFLEVIPHANIPLSAGLTKALYYIKKGVAAVKGAIQGWMQAK